MIGLKRARTSSMPLEEVIWLNLLEVIPTVSADQVTAVQHRVAGSAFHGAHDMRFQGVEVDRWWQQLHLLFP